MVSGNKQMSCDLSSYILVAHWIATASQWNWIRSFAVIIALQVRDVGVLHLRSRLLNDLLGAVLVHGNRITAQDCFCFNKKVIEVTTAPLKSYF